MDNEVIQLKKKIKTLQKQLCERTRNYLYHFKKSPANKINSTTDQQSQTQPYDQLIQDMTQTQNFIQETQNFIQESLFANVNLQNFNQTSLQSSNINENEQIQQKKVKSRLLTLDLNNDNQQMGTGLREYNEFNEESRDINNGEIDNLALEIKLMKQQLQNSKTPRNKQQLNFYFLQSPSILSTPAKQTPNSLMEFSKKRQFNTIEEETDLKSNAQSTQKMIEYDHLSKQIKIMEKQIKKLKTILEHQVHASSQTKTALLISEQENYKFRLKIQRMNKQIQILTGASTDSDVQRYQRPLIFQAQQPALSSIDSDKSQSTKEELEKFKGHAEKYEQHIFILQGVKRDYLKKCIQAKEEIYKLKQQNEKHKQENQNLKVQNGELKSALNNQRSSLDNQRSSLDGRKLKESQQMGIKWEQVVRSKIHEISNCLPMGQNQEMFLFKPDTVQDSIQVLDRILIFCKNIEYWEREKIQTIEKERANLLKVMSGVLMRQPDTKQAMCEEILEIDELKYLVNFLNKEPKSSKISRILTIFNSCEQISKNQVIEEIRTK